MRGGHGARAAARAGGFALRSADLRRVADHAGPGRCRRVGARVSGGLPDRPRGGARAESDSTHMNPNPIIVALDYETAAEASALVTRLSDRVNFYKVGMELYAAAGMAFAKELRAQGKDV